MGFCFWIFLDHTKVIPPPTTTTTTTRVTSRPAGLRPQVKKALTSRPVHPSVASAVWFVDCDGGRDMEVGKSCGWLEGGSEAGEPFLQRRSGKERAEKRGKYPTCAERRRRRQTFAALHRSNPAHRLLLRVKGDFPTSLGSPSAEGGKYILEIYIHAPAADFDYDATDALQREKGYIF